MVKNARILFAIPSCVVRFVLTDGKPIWRILRGIRVFGRLPFDALEKWGYTQSMGVVYAYTRTYHILKKMAEESKGREKASAKNGQPLL